MKRRTGFVSNSSSSSFVVIDPGLRTTAEVAWTMISIVIDNWAAWDPKWEGFSEYCRSAKAALDFLDSNLDLDEPITFPWSTNEETYIWRNSKGQICVDTCNNHSWEDEIRYKHAGDDWKWYDSEWDDILMDRWQDVEYLNLATRQRAQRSDWSATERRKRDCDGKNKGGIC